MAGEQTYKNHARIRPAYHYGVTVTLVPYFVWSVYRVWQAASGETVMGLVLATGLILLAFTLRAQVLTVQDRLIRLEMRLRLRQQLAEDLAARAEHLPVKQLVALRFAADHELPAIVREVVDGAVTEPKEIKKRITDWQGDHLRA